MEKTRNQYEKEKTMTLFKQMALGISMLILSILAAVMIENYQSAKKNMVEVLYQITVNNISALSNRLSENGVPAVIQSIIDAEFDSGYYKLIELKSDTFDYKQEDESSIENVPLWFVKFANIKFDPIATQVTSGWSVLGTLTVIPDANIIYITLYETFKNLLSLFAVFALLSLLILSIMLHFILEPLKKMKQQAEAVLKNKFIKQKQMPYTTEFRDVSLAMNSMVSRVEEIYNQAREEAQRNKDLLYKDPITHLFNRRYLMIKLPELLSIEGETEGGAVILLALDGAEHINTVLGRREADTFFLKFANILQDAVEMNDESLVARVNGTEFTIVLPNYDTKRTLDVTESINAEFNILLEYYKISHAQVSINMGLYRYPQNIAVSELLIRVDTALLKAKVDETQNVILYTDEDKNEAMTKTEWKEILEYAIEFSKFDLIFYPVYDTQTNSLLHKVMTFNIISQNGESYQYGKFIAPAINLGLTTQLYLKLLSQFFANYKDISSDTEYSIRLSKEFLQDESSFDALEQLFSKYAKKAHCRLCFEVSDSFAIHNTATLKGFVDLFKKYDFNIGVNSFTGEANEYDYLKDISPEFIKANSDFLIDQSSDSMNALHFLANSLNIDIIATYVNTLEQIGELQRHKITKIQGPVVEQIK
jgi:diguanylate cyclase (GGDEF)-like protein